MLSRHFATALTVLALASGMAACTVKTEA
ncbi:MAG: hypothetical protein K0S65_5809, partial [Labilithrix sp.]|nr:hypothetical protein [Labilithrix sp.]